MGDVSVRVALRIRPLVKTELEKGCQVCLDTVPGVSQIQVRGTDRAFTFNHVFPPEVSQEEFYNTAIKGMVNNLFQGYNVTILAYGQTGSGKTHSMGTTYSSGEDMGVIPRAVSDIFTIVESKDDWDFKITVSFMELYQEHLYDLLSDKPRNQCIVDIREDTKGIKIQGLTEREVVNAENTIQCLTQGSLGRATGATAMNSQSSRSHAIFTITIQQQKRDNPNTATTAKFHLVDLAGSERSKKTQATGERFKEGVNINKGLLALGNVISQLGDGGVSSYIGYRDSKLTRLLQDSLGGNSMTLMIACVSPADYNLDETVSTLRYADRARRIKNKPIVNQDPRAAEINRLNKLVQELRLALLGQGTSNAGGISCPPEHREFQEKSHAMQKKIRDLTDRLNTNLIELVHMHERAELAEKAREKINMTMAKILEECKDVMDTFNENPNDTDAHHARLKTMYNKILEFLNDQRKTTEEILHHELSTGMQVSTTSIPDADEEEDSSNFEDDNHQDVDGSMIDLDEKQEEHTMQQADRNNEVQNINREVALKEELVSKLMANASQMVEYSNELNQMEQEIKTLQVEKEDLLKTLQNIQSNNASSKIAEARRKKVQELEKKISELSRKCMEQGKVIKMKEKSDQMIKNLVNEIQSMKQLKVKLVKQMRVENDRFNQWKKSREREVSKLKDQDRKRQNQMVRMENQHSKQQNVLKRKVEEACAINKRLKEALEMQRKAQQRREKASGSKEGIQAWVTQELQVLVSTVDAERSLEQLMRDRAHLTTKLDKLKANTDKCETAAYKKQIAALTEDLELRSAQIADLQQKILDSDQENKARTRWNFVQSMSDAKCALKTLFETAANMRRDQYTKNYEYDELMDECDKLRMRLRQYELQQKEQGAKQREELARLHAEQEERIAVLLEQLRGSDKGSAEDEDKTMERLKEQLDYYKSECERQKHEIEVAGPLKNQSVLALRNSGTNSRKTNGTEKGKHQVPYHTVDFESSINESDISFTDDKEKDPDWTKTPLYDRIKKALSTTETLADTSRNAPKRTSDGEVKCSCRTMCSTKICSCRKNGLICTNCNCDPQKCQNKDKENMRRTLFTDFSEDEKSDDSFKRPRTRLSTRSSYTQSKFPATLTLEEMPEVHDETFDVKHTNDNDSF